MKKTIGLLLILITGVTGFCQEILNNPTTEVIPEVQQIRTAGLDQLLQQQLVQQSSSNYIMTSQTGTGNKAMVNQLNDQSSALSNQSQLIQSGNFNEFTIGQVGSGNILLAFQLGYLSFNSGVTTTQSLPLIGTLFESLFSTESSGSLSTGERNKLDLNQSGTGNGAFTLQQGNDNKISAGQTGKNNFLLVLQNGNYNSVEGYLQVNVTEQPLFDSILQNGEHLKLTSSGASDFKLSGNSFIQSGTNLSIQVNNEFLNTTNGVEISQTGRDMEVIVDQSYFSFPME